MTQIATVEKKLGAGYVEISVPRKSACGHDCEECAGCGMTGAANVGRSISPRGGKCDPNSMRIFKYMPVCDYRRDKKFF